MHFESDEALLCTDRPAGATSRAAGAPSLNIVIIGLTITSSWGNGHATTYRGLVRELVRRGHNVVFLEQDRPWYAGNRDMPHPPFGHTEIYRDVGELQSRFAADVRNANLVIVGSYVADGVEVGRWITSAARGITAFYDIDTPVTLAKLARQDHEYLSPELVPRYQIYLSFTGGPTLQRLQQEYGSPAARALYCAVDPELYYPAQRRMSWDIGYLGTYSPDRQPALEGLLLDAARQEPELKCVVAGPQYPEAIVWPANVRRICHLPPDGHCAFYCSQRFTLNITRQEMIRAGYSPSVRLFEAAACGVPIISDYWDGLETFFVPAEEIFVSRSAAETLRIIRETEEEQRRRVAERARNRVLHFHTAAHRAADLERYVLEVLLA